MFQTDFVIALIMLFILLPAARFLRRFIYALFDMFDRGNPIDEAGKSMGLTYLKAKEGFRGLKGIANIAREAFGGGKGGGPSPSGPVASGPSGGGRGDGMSGIMNETNAAGSNGFENRLGKTGGAMAGIGGALESQGAMSGVSRGLDQVSDFSGLSDLQQDTPKTYGYLPETQENMLQPTGTDGLSRQDNVVPMDALRRALDMSRPDSAGGFRKEVGNGPAVLKKQASRNLGGHGTVTGQRSAFVPPAGRTLSGSGANKQLGREGVRTASAITSVATGAISHMSGLNGQGNGVIRTVRQSSGAPPVRRTAYNSVSPPSRSSSVVGNSNATGNYTTGVSSVAGRRHTRHTAHSVHSVSPGRSSYSQHGVNRGLRGQSHHFSVSAHDDRQVSLERKQSIHTAHQKQENVSDQPAIRNYTQEWIDGERTDD
ncbi:hypothetical protein CathTA2_0676 [Caldalkalibacillus thermarum TA2.A1]|uniref:Uncharacterized protein n=1 Tax=Caldalkalibacillus thermarum (strain TA2.A1) TaxID=986075 RepID=F5L4G4_CALTT|nr:hypothetical protein [Caldalkalibacillus thermarum]EGL83775.1 hypothetical protein CathTA2_0676 [Caldalkalibacillus thermarum TA2.A1]QZT33711.1 hypothetical protein HUR95_16050 [Caldalkalibacillus thermarum TA2.A1]